MARMNFWFQVCLALSHCPKTHASEAEVEMNISFSLIFVELFISFFILLRQHFMNHDLLLFLLDKNGFIRVSSLEPLIPLFH